MVRKAAFLVTYFVTFFTKSLYSAFYLVSVLAFASLPLQIAISEPMEPLLLVLLFVVIAAAV